MSSLLLFSQNDQKISFGTRVSVLALRSTVSFSLSPQELYQKLTDFDIRFYMYELLKVSVALVLSVSLCLSLSLLDRKSVV